METELADKWRARGKVEARLPGKLFEISSNRLEKDLMSLCVRERLAGGQECEKERERFDVSYLHQPGLFTFSSSFLFSLLYTLLDGLLLGASDSFYCTILTTLQIVLEPLGEGHLSATKRMARIFMVKEKDSCGQSSC